MPLDRQAALAKAKSLLSLALNHAAAPEEARTAAVAACRLISEHRLLQDAREFRVTLPKPTAQPWPRPSRQERAWKHSQYTSTSGFHADEHEPKIAGIDLDGWSMVAVAMGANSLRIHLTSDLRAMTRCSLFPVPTGEWVDLRQIPAERRRTIEEIERLWPRATRCVTCWAL